MRRANPPFIIAVGFIAALITNHYFASVAVNAMADSIIGALAVLFGRSAWLPVLRGRISLKTMVLVSVTAGIGWPLVVQGALFVIALLASHGMQFPTPPEIAQNRPNLFALVIAGPIAETFICQFWLQRNFGPVFAGVVFFALHLTLNPQIVIAAILLGTIQYKTRSVACTMLAHMLFNLSVFALYTLAVSRHWG